MRAKNVELVHLHARVPAKVAYSLEDYCINTGMTKSAVIERAVNEYIESHDDKKGGKKHG